MSTISALADDPDLHDGTRTVLQITLSYPGMTRGPFVSVVTVPDDCPTDEIAAVAAAVITNHFSDQYEADRGVA